MEKITDLSNFRNKKMLMELTDLTGRSVRENKRGFIQSGTPKILHPLGLDE